MKLHSVLALFTAIASLSSLVPARAATPGDVVFQAYVDRATQQEVRPVVYRSDPNNASPDADAKDLRQRLMYWQ